MDPSPGNSSRNTGSPLRSLLFLLTIVLILWLSYPLLQGDTNPALQNLPDNPLIDASAGLGASLPTVTATATQPAPSAFQSGQLNFNDGLLVMALSEGADRHLFLYHPQHLKLTRLTSGAWQDIHPAVHPEGDRIAFASNRSGSWDLYILDLQTGRLEQVTDTPEYEASPSWSPDGLWLAYESYLDGNLDIYVRPVANDQPAIRLTDHPAADFSPSWSPQGRQLAFVSVRGGENDIWSADLDRIEGRFTNISNTAEIQEDRPLWSPSGEHLAWSGTRLGERFIYIWDPASPISPARFAGSGDWPAWSPSGEQLAARLSLPNRTYLTAYQLDDSQLTTVPQTLPGSLEGLAWGRLSLPDKPAAALAQAAAYTPQPLWREKLTASKDLPSGRYGIVTLEDLAAPLPQLSDRADEAFTALREAVARQAGWDYLAQLDNAFQPLTAPALPSLEGSWLYTGRGLSANSAPLHAGWLVIVREDYNDQTYWRIYVRARMQDGSQGQPLTRQVWDLTVRSSGDTRAYEQGGLRVTDIPSGYWIDLTDLAIAYGWERLPALSTWRSYYPAARITDFALIQGTDWRSALLELYPPEMLITPTPVASPTITPTPTVTPTRTRYPTWTPRPTNTPYPSRTPTITPTPLFSATPDPWDFDQ